MRRIGPWLSDQSGFLLSYNVKQFDPWQIWFRSYPRGNLQRITNDLKDYYDLCLNSDGKLLSAVESETLVQNVYWPIRKPGTLSGRDHGQQRWLRFGLDAKRDVTSAKL